MSKKCYLSVLFVLAIAAAKPTCGEETRRAEQPTTLPSRWPNVSYRILPFNYTRQAHDADVHFCQHYLKKYRVNFKSQVTNPNDNGLWPVKWNGPKPSANYAWARTMEVFFKNGGPHDVQDVDHSQPFQLVTANRSTHRLPLLKQQTFQPILGRLIIQRGASSWVVHNDPWDQDLVDSVDLYSISTDFIYQIRIRFEKNGVKKMFMTLPFYATTKAISANNLKFLIDQMLDSSELGPSFENKVPTQIEIAVATSFYEFSYFSRSKPKKSSTAYFVGVGEYVQSAAKALARRWPATQFITRLVFNQGYNVAKVFQSEDFFKWTNGKSE